MQPRHGDLLLGLGVATALAVVVSSDQGRGGAVDPRAYVWAVGFGALMLLRRQHPVLVLVLTALGYFSYHAAGFPAIGVAVPMAAALYSAAEMGHVPAAGATALVTLGGATGYRLLAGQDPALVLGYELVSHGAPMLAVVALGHSVRTGRRLRLRTEQVTRLLDRQGTLDAEARLREERVHLARELHDSIGHSLAIASLYANVARDADDDPERRRSALELVRSGVSDSLAHLRRTVALLRTPGSDAVPSTPRLTDLTHLVAAPSRAGYDVLLEVDDVRAPPEVEAAAFRVVQEAVTNTVRHSTGTRIRVRVREEPRGHLSVEVADDGAPVTTDDPGQGHGLGHGLGHRQGHGLSGLAERVHGLGGRLEARPTGEGWVVRADVPMEADR
ncbi:histidine kinase [Nocardioides sp. TF02-7]|uniref:sensor histidine kinase n=1 Tax=Nocardioides sp. TF02-7 TaxID=2917724 RepID=UPI001F070911|nr:histidine kinase [Nocardioides sp. TF02-7]UMG91854.1 histidine kinase [Nocardioides sp. TF02-7]